MAIWRLSDAAQADIIAVLGWTQEHFGEQARLRYEHLVVTALRDLAAEPMRAGSVDRPEIGAGIRSYHLYHSRRRARLAGTIVHRPRHLLLYRSLPSGVIGSGRVLHDAMDLERHIPGEFSDT